MAFLGVQRLCVLAAVVSLTAGQVLPPLLTQPKTAFSPEPAGNNVEAAASDAEDLDAYCNDSSPDCEEREHLCRNSVFHPIMLERCPRTCNLCHELLTRQSGGERERSEEDYEQPQPEPDTDANPDPPTLSPTIVSTSNEMPETTTAIRLSKLVGSAERFLPELESEDEHETAKKPKCRDFASDCGAKARLCENLYYHRIMDRFCRKTCGFCDDDSNERSTALMGAVNSYKRRKLPFNSRGPVVATRGRGSGVRKPKTPRGAATSNGKCVDLGIDCFDKRTLCNHKAYTSLMTRMCPQTCNLCPS